MAANIFVIIHCESNETTTPPPPNFLSLSPFSQFFPRRKKPTRKKEASHISRLKSVKNTGKNCSFLFFATSISNIIQKLKVSFLSKTNFDYSLTIIAKLDMLSNSTPPPPLSSSLSIVPFNNWQQISVLNKSFFFFTLKK